MLTAEDRPGRGHSRLDEGVTDPGPDRGVTLFLDDLGNRERGDEVVDDRGPGLALQFLGGHQCGDGRWGYGFTTLVDDEASVGIPVEGQADVGVGLADLGL